MVKVPRLFLLFGGAGNSAGLDPSAPGIDNFPVSSSKLKSISNSARLLTCEYSESSRGAVEEKSSPSGTGAPEPAEDSLLSILYLFSSDQSILSCIFFFVQELPCCLEDAPTKGGFAANAVLLEDVKKDVSTPELIIDIFQLSRMVLIETTTG